MRRHGRVLQKYSGEEGVKSDEFRLHARAWERRMVRDNIGRHVCARKRKMCGARKRKCGAKEKDKGEGRGGGQRVSRVL
jgi:hypothetical protein